MPLTNESVVGTLQWKAMMAIVMNNESIAVNQHVREQIFCDWSIGKVVSLTVCSRWDAASLSTSRWVVCRSQAIA
jgi:hypothetical protein